MNTGRSLEDPLSLSWILFCLHIYISISKSFRVKNIFPDFVEASTFISFGDSGIGLELELNSGLPRVLLCRSLVESPNHWPLSGSNELPFFLYPIFQLSLQSQIWDQAQRVAETWNRGRKSWSRKLENFLDHWH